MADPRTILITGGAGNLGTKLAAHLSMQPWCERIILCDVVAPRAVPPKAEALQSDLLDPAGGWREAARVADAVVHFAAVNPYPDATFADAADSLQMTANLFLALADTAARLVFATSNHVMGRYKEEAVAAGKLTTDLPPLPGTRAIENGILKDSPAYASAKLMGERLLVALAGAPRSRVTGVALRIGWCQPGENHPRTISGDGMPVDTDAKPVTGDALRDLIWFRNMWLSGTISPASSEAWRCRPVPLRLAWPAGAGAQSIRTMPEVLRGTSLRRAAISATRRRTTRGRCSASSGFSTWPPKPKRMALSIFSAKL